MNRQGDIKMKIDANVRWLIDDPEQGIVKGNVEKVPVDADYVDADEGRVYDWIEEEIAIRHPPRYLCGKRDFVIENVDEVVDALP